MKYLFFILFLGWVKEGVSQSSTSDTGVHFLNGKRWQEALTKAKKENKFIFVDAYTTWCSPCKAMDKFVYSKASVAQYLDQHFISVKFQMDTSKNDGEDIKQLYSDAHAFQESFQVNLFPTLLFFNPDGQLVHRAAGYKVPDDFLQLTKHALDPKYQYYTLLGLYERGEASYQQVKYLAFIARELQDSALAAKLAKDYVHKYLDQLEPAFFLRKDNFQFYEAFPKELTSKSKAFDAFQHQPAAVDSAVGIPHYASASEAAIIFFEEITPSLVAIKKVQKEPDWKLIYESIAQKFGKPMAEKLILEGKFRAFKIEQKWEDAAGIAFQQISRYGFDSTGLGPLFNTNSLCWDIVFLHCDNPTTLAKCLPLMEGLLKTYSAGDESNLHNFIDTYANLLYKLGRKNDAIDEEQKAIQINEELHAKKNVPLSTSLPKTLAKMKAGEKTW